MPPAICGDDVKRGLVQRQLALAGEDQRDRRIEMRAGDRTEHGDQDNQNGPGRQGVAEQRKRDVLGQRFGHDAGADNGRDEKTRAERFGGQAPRKVEIVHQRLRSFRFGEQQAWRLSTTGSQTSGRPPQQSRSRKTATSRNSARLAR